MNIKSIGRGKSHRFPTLRECMLLLAVAAATPAWANDYTVGCGATADTDLYNAIGHAVDIGGSTVTLTAGCTYTMTWNGTTKAADGSPTIFLTVANPITVIGNGATIALGSASQPARFFYIASAGALTLRNLALTGGISRGADGGNSSTSGTPGAGGAYSGLGGAILNDGALDANAVTFAGNQAIGGNGGRGMTSSTYNVGPSGAGGGGGMGGAVFSRGSLQIAQSTFNGNAARGGIPSGYAAPCPSGSTCINTGGGGGGAGGIGGQQYGNGGNGNFGGGGGAAGWGGQGLPNGGAGGFAGGGGEGWSGGAGGEFGGDGAAYAFSGGAGGGLGGAIFVESTSGSAQIVNSTFGANSAGGGATGLDVGGNWNPGGNGGSGAGGAVFVHTGSLTMIADTVAGNSVSGGNVTNAANAQNGGNAQGGNLYVHSGAALDLAQTIVTGGTVTAGTTNKGNTGAASDPDVFGAITSQGYNLVTTRGDSSGYVSTDLADTTAANLGALAGNGGATQTMLPQTGSAAIDAIPSAACNVAVDQRNEPRPYGAGCDIGSVEVNDIIFRDGFDGPASSPLPAVECSGATSSSVYFSDDFSGSALGTQWNAHANGGTIAVANNSVALSSTATQFPFVTAISPIPATGDFSVRWLATYTNASGNGDGTLVISHGLPANNATDNYNLRAADAWQDSSNGFQVRARTTSSGNYSALLTVLPPSLTQHDVEYCWMDSNNTVQIWVDGVLQLQSPSSGLPRPDAIWFGNPVNRGSSGSPWNGFTLHSVSVRSVTP